MSQNRMNKEEWKEAFIRIMHQMFGTDLQTCRMKYELFIELNLDLHDDPSESVKECAENWCNSM